MSTFANVCLICWILLDFVCAHPMSKAHREARTSNEMVGQSLHLFDGQSKNSLHETERVVRNRSEVASPLHARVRQENHTSLDLNTSSSASPDLPASASHIAPQFMLDLFTRFQNDPQTQPASNIIRSFFNDAKDDHARSAQHYASCRAHRRGCTRKHDLRFDISSTPSHERVTMAELRLYKIVEHDRKTYTGINRKVEVFEVHSGHRANSSHQPSRKRILGSKLIFGRSSGWETFYLTGAFRRWVRHPGTEVHLQVYIESISGDELDDAIDVEQKSNDVHEPLLIVFSDDSRRHHRSEQLEELNNLLHGNNAHGDVTNMVDSNQHHLHKRNTEEDAQKLDVRPSVTAGQRLRRSATERCHLEPMQVNFKDIGYDWVISPETLAAGKCVGTCDLPFPNEDVTFHAVMQAWMNQLAPNEHSKPCCVPTKLGSIAMLYHYKNTLTYKYNYDGMKVLECGCR